MEKADYMKAVRTVRPEAHSYTKNHYHYILDMNGLDTLGSGETLEEAWKMAYENVCVEAPV